MSQKSDGSTASYYELPDGAKTLFDLAEYRDMNSEIGHIFFICYRGNEHFGTEYLPQGATELQDLISYCDMNGQIAEIFRACYRYGLASHSDRMRDARKILFYAQAEETRVEKYVLTQGKQRLIADARAIAHHAQVEIARLERASNAGEKINTN